MKITSSRRSLAAAVVAFALLTLVVTGAAFALSKLDPGLRFQLGVPAATQAGEKYSELHVSHTVGDTTVTLSRATLTNKQVVVGYTYVRPVQGQDDSGYAHICVMSLTSREGDTFRAGAIDDLPGTVKDGVVHGSSVIYFQVIHLESGSADRHLRLVLQPQPCSPSGDDGKGIGVAFDFTLPVQK